MCIRDRAWTTAWRNRSIPIADERARPRRSASKAGPGTSRPRVAPGPAAMPGDHEQDRHPRSRSWWFCRRSCTWRASTQLPRIVPIFSKDRFIQPIHPTMRRARARRMFTPVSYTHLDVYKRQRWRSRAPARWCSATRRGKVRPVFSFRNPQGQQRADAFAIRERGYKPWRWLGA